MVTTKEQIGDNSEQYYHFTPVSRAASESHYSLEHQQMPDILRIATRKSPLAIWQAEEVQRHLKKAGADSELVKMSTRGDEILDQPLAKIGGKGLFIKELERGMLAGEADMAAHSMKDLPSVFPEGLHLGAIMSRENPSDAFVSNKYNSVEELPEGAVVGTCSLRRRCQLLAKFPHLNIKDLRGNVNTRLAKLDSGRFDAIILASAGLIRLELQDRIKSEINMDIMLPACAQGAVGIECKSDDVDVNTLLEALHDKKTAYRIHCERSLNATLGGSCQTPIAAYAELNGDTLHLRARVGTPDGKLLLVAEDEDNRSNAVALGERVGRKLLADGAQKIIDDLALDT